jgi:NAD(P)-dependent dehydrogenase (short-subunit alcohol dehydrogenase family)
MKSTHQSVAMSPGAINTPMHANGNHAALAKLHPLDRMGEASDVVDAVLYLKKGAREIRVILYAKEPSYSSSAETRGEEICVWIA